MAKKPAQSQTPTTPDESGFAEDFLTPRLLRVTHADGSVNEEETRRNTFNAVNDGALELAQSDANWGLLAKTGGANVDGYAADIWLYNLGNGTAQVVDVVSDSEGHEGVPEATWGLADLRPVDQWKPAFGSGEPVPEPGPGPDPNPEPGPTPEPGPCPDLMANPTYDTWVKSEGGQSELQTYRNAYVDKHHREPGLANYAHFAWIRLREFVPLDTALMDV